jgi:GNAT superfamily N-acetyltransferase
VPQRLLRVGADWIPRFQPLWESLRRHHVAVAPQLAELRPVRAPEESWAIRRGLYEQWLAEPDAFAMVALVDDDLVGYALVSWRPPEESWVTGDRVAELETLAVLPEQRGKGTGRALMIGAVPPA